jgi:hypothetical protein
LEAAGRADLAEELLRFLIRHFSGTPAAVEAQNRFTVLRSERVRGGGRTGFIVWGTTYGAFLGLAVPAALGANEPEPFGAGLLLGPPTGFFASKAYANANPLSAGQTHFISWTTVWAGWQAVGWRAALDIGEGQRCDEWGCYDTGPSDEAPWQAAVLGSLGGLGVSLIATRSRDISPKSAEMARHGSLWGLWYATAGLILADVDDEDAVITWLLLGGNLGFVGGLLAGPAWDVTAGQVRLVSIAGVAGLIAGGGLDLLIQPDDEKVAIMIPTATATAALIAAATMAKPAMADAPGTDAGFDTALLQWDRGVRIGVPMPMPAALPALRRDGRIGATPGLRLTLFDARF